MSELHEQEDEQMLPADDVKRISGAEAPERPVSIRADQWDTIAEAVARGDVTAKSKHGNSVIRLVDKHDGWAAFKEVTKGAYLTCSHSHDDTFTLEWLDKSEAAPDGKTPLLTTVEDEWAKANLIHSVEENPLSSALKQWKERALKAENESERLQSELVAANERAAKAEGQAGKLRRTLEPFSRIFGAWLERKDIETHFTNWLFKYLEEVGLAPTLFVRAWFEEAREALDEGEAKP